MMRYYFFVCILLTTLSVVNGIPLNKRATLFRPCNSTTPTLDIKINPDPFIPGTTSTFTFKGALAAIADTGSLLKVIFVDPTTLDDVNDPNARYVQNLCVIGLCPTTFVYIDVDIPIPNVGMPVVIIVEITDANESETLACAISAPTGPGAPPPSLKF